jgi:hypothetical protein
MFYFFHKQSQFIRFELRPHGAVGRSACDIIVHEEGRPERVEHYADWDAANARWEELKRQFQRDGWQGPQGRE